jgi:hypothetical protein
MMEMEVGDTDLVSLLENLVLSNILRNAVDYSHRK